MKAKGHAGFGFLLLTPVILNKHLPTFDISNYTISNLINDKINEINLFISKIADINSQNIIFIFFMLFIFYIGIRIPDLDLELTDYFGYENGQRYKYHRQITHSLLLTLILIFSGNIYLFILGYGILTHLIGDMITGSVPIFLTGHYYPTFNFFKWRIGIDSLYIYIPKSEFKEFIKDKINRLKDFFVDIAEKSYSTFLLTFAILFIYIFMYK